MKNKLRDYQEKIINDCVKHIERNEKRILIVSGCGTGKTFIAGNLIKVFVSQGKKVLFIVDRKELIDQTFSEFSKLDIDCGFIKSDYCEKRSASTQIASVQTLPKRLWWKEHNFDIVIVDEAHEVAFHNFVKKELMEEILPKSVFIGLTGTPYRLSSKESMKDIFNVMVKAPVPSEMQSKGYLVPTSYFSIGEVNLQGVKSYKGDYKENDLSIVCDKPDIIEKIVKEWLRRAVGRRTIGFCVNVQHAENTCEAFRKHNIPCVVVTANTPMNTRRAYYDALSKGKLHVILSVDCLSKGFNEVSAEVALLLRPTKSKALYEQQIGRVLRESQETGKTDALILDQAGNVKRHGFIEDIKVYRFERVKDSDESNPVPLKECEACSHLDYGFAKVCGDCGHPYPVKEKLESNGELVRVFASDTDKKLFQEYQSLIKTAYQSGHKPGYALVQFKQRYNKFPKSDWGLGAVFGDMPENENFVEYFEHLTKKDDSAQNVKRWMTVEFGESWKKYAKNNSEFKAKIESLEGKIREEVNQEIESEWSEIVQCMKPSVKALVKNARVRQTIPKLVIEAKSNQWLGLLKKAEVGIKEGYAKWLEMDSFSVTVEVR